jgi:hypothetical protein
MNRRSRIRLGPVLAIALFVLGSSGCGSDASHPSQPAVGKGFQNRAEAVCQAALTQKKGLGPFPYPSFNPTRPDLSKLPPIARLEAKTVKIYDTWLRRMLALGQPPTGKATWGGVVTAQRTNGRIIADQQAAARRVDGPTFTKDYYDGNKAQQELERASTAAGLPVCTAAAAA